MTYSQLVLQAPPLLLALLHLVERGQPVLRIAFVLLDASKLPLFRFHLGCTKHLESCTGSALASSKSRGMSGIKVWQGSNHLW